MYKMAAESALAVFFFARFVIFHGKKSWVLRKSINFVSVHMKLTLLLSRNE
jgi:hypothetical protein